MRQLLRDVAEDEDEMKNARGSGVSWMSASTAESQRLRRESGLRAAVRLVKVIARLDTNIKVAGRILGWAERAASQPLS